MRIDSSGNVGIGNSAPASMVGGTANTAIVTIGGGDGSIVAGDRAGTLSFKTEDPTYKNVFSDGICGEIASVSDSPSGASYALAFHTGTIGGTNRGERMRIDSSGNLLVGTTDSTIFNHTTGEGVVIGPNAIQISRNSDQMFLLNRMTTNGPVAGFYAAGVGVGSITVTGTATSYLTSSDQRLKDNIVDAPSASDDIDAIQVRSFDWKADGSHQKYGMVAQELNTVAPEAVSEGETEEDMMGVDYSKLVPMLVKEIQSLRARVAQLETN